MKIKKHQETKDKLWKDILWKITFKTLSFAWLPKEICFPQVFQSQSSSTQVHRMGPSATWLSPSPPEFVTWASCNLDPAISAHSYTDLENVFHTLVLFSTQEMSLESGWFIFMNGLFSLWFCLRWVLDLACMPRWRHCCKTSL